MKRGNRRPPAARMIYAASERCADLLYATGFLAPDPFLWLSVDGQAMAVLSELEIGRARKQMRPGVEVLSHTEAGRRWRIGRRPQGGAVALAAACAKSCGVRKWSVPADFPLELARRLARRGVEAEPVREFFPERRRKRAEEIEHIRAGVRLAELGLARAMEVLRGAQPRADGRLLWGGGTLTAECLRGEIAAAIARAGGTAAHTIAAPGPQGADPHRTGEGPIQLGQPIVLDIFPRDDATGYFGDLTRTVVKGRAPEAVRKAFAAVQAAKAQAMAAIHAGVAGRQVHEAAAAELSRHGFVTDANARPPHGFFHGLGHGLGLDVHEAPRVSARSEDVLEAGNVVTVEPGLYYPEWGGIRIEDVVAVTASGCENLTTADTFLEIE